ncbi:hypothetical protein H0H87_000816 [Tephrocybe sp. NHM501043]|nr:hypothetical protein H0H87_000816 [Tephrocybe sp. NHM501043]
MLRMTCRSSEHHYLAYSRIIHPSHTRVELVFDDEGPDDFFPRLYLHAEALGTLVGRRYSDSVRRLEIRDDPRTCCHMLKFFDKANTSETDAYLKLQLEYQSALLDTFCMALNLPFLEHLTFDETDSSDPDLSIFSHWPKITTLVYRGNPKALASQISQGFDGPDASASSEGGPCQNHDAVTPVDNAPLLHFPVLRNLVI